MKKYSIGDSVTLKSGKEGIIEDYDDEFYYVKDFNGYVNRIRKVSDAITSIKKLKEQFPNITNFNDIISLDPTYDGSTVVAGKYGEWLLRMYKNNTLSEQSFDKASEILSTFNSNIQRLKSAGTNTDINAYKNLDELDNALDVLENRSEARKNREVRNASRNTDLNKDAELYMSTENFNIWIPLTYESSVKLGRGTNWCTATNSRREMYDEYTENGNKLYILINKNDKTEKYQWNTKKRYINDKENMGVNEYDLCDKYNDLAEFFNNVGYNIIIVKNDLEEIKKGKEYLYDGRKEIEKEFKPYIKKIKILNTVKHIKYRTFHEFENLESVDIPDSVGDIGYMAFRNCKNLKSINIPDSVTIIDDYAFSLCENLTSVKLPESILKIGDGVFGRCKNLRYINIPESVVEIGSFIFGRCNNLTVSTNNLLILEFYVLDGCEDLTIRTNNQDIIKYCKENDIKYITDTSVSDSVSDKDEFVNKFREELSNKYFKSRQAMKSPYNDVTWVNKNMSKEQLEDYILKQITCKGYNVYSEDNNYLVFKLTDAKTVNKLAPETTWCIKKEKVFNFYDRKGAVHFMLINKKNPSVKYVITYMDFDPDNTATLTDWTNTEVETIPNQPAINGKIFKNRKHPDLRTTLTIWIENMTKNELHYIFDDLGEWEEKDELNSLMNQAGMRKMANFIDDHLEEQDEVIMGNRRVQRAMWEAEMNM